MRILMTLAVVVVSAWVSGCGEESCDELCAKGNACSADGGSIECSEFCNGLETMTKTNCGKEYGELLMCERDAEDACVEDLCKAEFDTLAVCTVLYCGAAFDAPGCDAIRDGLSN